MATQSKRPQIGILNKLYEAIGKGYSVINGMHKAQAQETLEVSRKNWIINGDMQVSQRGDYTSATAATNGTYYLDRWKSAVSGITANVQHTSITLPSGETVNALKYIATSAATGYAGAYQAIEDFASFKGKTVSVSVWIRAAGVKGNVYTHDGVGYIGKELIVEGTGDLTKLTFTGKVDDSATYLRVYCVTTSETDASQAHVVGDYIEFTQVKLEIGDTATPFEVEPYAEVLRKCQRYYQRWGDNASGDNYPVISNCHLETATEARGAIVFQTRMRTAPTMSASGSFRVYTTTALSVSGLGFQAATTTCAPISATCSSGTAGHGGILQANNDAAAYIAADAEIL